MPIVDLPKIGRDVIRDEERYLALGLTHQDFQKYAHHILVNGDDSESVQAAFESVIAGRNLSEDDRIFVKEHLYRGLGYELTCSAL